MSAHILQPSLHTNKERKAPTIDQIKADPYKYQHTGNKVVPKYRLTLFPLDPKYYDEIQSQVELRHSAWIFDKWDGTGEEPEPGPPSMHRVIEDGLLVFETIREPRLEGEFSDFTTDDEFIGKHCQVVGHLQQLDLGDCMMSFHILEPAVHPSDLRDPIDDRTDGEDDW